MKLQPKPKKEKTFTDRLAYHLGELLGLAVATFFLLITGVFFFVVGYKILEILGGMF